MSNHFVDTVTKYKEKFKILWQERSNFMHFFRLAELIDSELKENGHIGLYGGNFSLSKFNRMWDEFWNWKFSFNEAFEEWMVVLQEIEINYRNWENKMKNLDDNRDLLNPIIQNLSIFVENLEKVDFKCPSFNTLVDIFCRLLETFEHIQGVCSYEKYFQDDRMLFDILKFFKFLNANIHCLTEMRDYVEKTSSRIEDKND